MSTGTIGHLNEVEPALQYEPGVVDPELVRQALQQVQHREGFGKGKVVPVWSVLIAAARYAIEDLQQAIRPPSKALTDDELDQLRQADNGALNFVTLREFRIVARAVERAHGIELQKRGEAMIPKTAHEALQHELSMIGSTIESFDSTAAALRALIDWHCAVAVDPAVNGGKVLVPVSTLKDAERYAWLKENCGERLTRRSLLNEFSEHKTEYIFPSLIAWADFCGQITLDEAIDLKMVAAKEQSDE